MPPYKEQFPVGTLVRTASLPELQEQAGNWKYHHPISDAHLVYGSQQSRVKNVAFYHGGDPLYTLEAFPQLLWHEFSLELV